MRRPRGRAGPISHTQFTCYHPTVPGTIVLGGASGSQLISWSEAPRGEIFLVADVEKPANGVAGLKHFRHDVVAGLLVALISLPFSLGIAVASGAPPIAGLVSAIIAGLILPFLGGSYVTISGPAAGLAPVLLSSMATLGHGDLAAGYPLLLCVIFGAGCVQIVLSLMKAARFSAMFPSAVVEGMLCSIGLMIIAKQLPNFIGHEFHAHEFFGLILETPRELLQMEPRVFGLGVACLVLVFALAASRFRWTKVIPPQLSVVAFAILVGWLLGIDDRFLIQIPDKPLEHGFTAPNFRGLFDDRELWLAALATLLTLTMIDGVESLATAMAIDKIDPFRRKSNPNRVLLAMGVSNICSSIAGGLTIIPGGVKSKACIVAGGRTLWANFYNAVFLIAFLFLARPLINRIPLSALAAILIYTGYKLCEPRVWRHIAHVGLEQILLFTVTVLVTLATDLLLGIIAGILVKLIMNGLLMMSAQPSVGDSNLRILAQLARNLWTQFRNPVLEQRLEAGVYHISFEGPLVCFNAVAVQRALGRIPSEASAVILRLTERVPLVDHTSCDNLIRFTRDFGVEGQAAIELVGMDRMRARSDYETCMRLAAPTAMLADDTLASEMATDVGQLLDPISPTSASAAFGAWEYRRRRDRHRRPGPEDLDRMGLLPLSREPADPQRELGMVGLVHGEPPLTEGHPDQWPNRRIL